MSKSRSKYIIINKKISVVILGVLAFTINSDLSRTTRLLFAINAVTAQDTTSNPQFSPSSTAGGGGIFPVSSGPIHDSSCDVEQLERANDSQLYLILNELRKTAFFRTFAVDLEQKCPVSFASSSSTSSSASTPSTSSSSSSTSKSKFGGNNNNNNIKKNSNGFSSSNKFSKNKKSPLFSKPGAKKEETEKCTGVLPDADPDAKPACSIDTSGTSDDSFFSSESFDSFNTKNKKSTKTIDTATNKATTTTTKTIDRFQKASETAKDESDEFHCDGGADELDDDAPPLCSVESSLGDSFEGVGEQQNLFSLPPSLSHKSEKENFSWDNPSDPVIDSPASTECNDDDESSASTLPDRFWTDICSNIKGSNLKPINLQLNPERNTGYNGTHIWNAIYEENCLNIDTEFSDMCFEERVLYRLISGLHTSTTLSIAKHYYPPSKRKNRVNWEPNPKLFYEKFIHSSSQGEEYIRNLYFSYVVLLRALHKAHDFLYLYEIRTGNVIEDQTATILLRRLLDTKFLDSCNTVFESFDESLMFQEDSAYISSKDEMLDMDLKEDLGQMFTSHSSSSSTVSLKQNFKGVFHNISSVLDCVQCQQCKLHGKMAMLGYGTALKILFLNKELIDSDTISRNEIVAFINTLAKMSDGMKDVKDLTQIYWASNAAESLKIPSDHSLVPIESNTTVNSIMQKPFSEIIQEQEGKVFDLVDEAIKCISKLASLNRISSEREEALVRMAFEKDPNLLILSKYYSRDLEKFEKFSSLIVVTTEEPGRRELPPDAIVIGGGLAGLAATLNILDRGGTVTLIEKEHVLGGNSAKASSGINACCPHNNTYGDEVESFMKDTVKSAGDAAQLHLISTLVGNSENAVTWLKDRVGVDLSLLAQLGGHSHKRTHRPSNGMAGAEIIFAIQKAVRKYEKKGKVKILVDSKVTQLITNDDHTRVIGVEYQNLKKPSKKNHQYDGSTPPPVTLLSPNIILTTGGFAADRTPKSYLEKYRPELMNMPATAGEFSTGDGISLATSLGAGMVDMDKIQIHPTGWVDPKDPENPNKVLAAELMRGVGGILINGEGKRFCNELGTRAYVTDRMLSHDPDYASEGKWNVEHKIPTFSLVLSSSAALDGQKHVNLYQHKGLLTKIEGIAALANWMNLTEKEEEEETLRQTMIQYQSSAKQGIDEWGKVSFRGVPSPDLENETFYAGTVTPVLHYCMGGVTIDEDGNVLNQNQEIIHGLHAAGEVSGGVHGNNRLGGNSLLECTVYGTIIGQKIPIQSTTTSSYQPKKEDEESLSKTVDVNTPISMEELSQHDSPEDCWVALHGTVYDLTDFAEEHPPGAESIHILAGKDGTEAFQAVHNMGTLEEFEDVKKGILVAS